MLAILNQIFVLCGDLEARRRWVKLVLEVRRLKYLGALKTS